MKNLNDQYTLRPSFHEANTNRHVLLYCRATRRKALHVRSFNRLRDIRTSAFSSLVRLMYLSIGRCNRTATRAYVQNEQTFCQSMAAVQRILLQFVCPRCDWLNAKKNALSRNFFVVNPQWALQLFFQLRIIDRHNRSDIIVTLFNISNDK